MKNRLTIGLTVFLLFFITLPAMALDVDFSGYYQVRGFCYHDYESFGYSGWSSVDSSDTLIGTITTNEEHASAYYDMLLGVNIVFKVHPRLKLITGFTALDKVWSAGDNDAASSGDDMEQARGEDTNNIDWNQAYMHINTGLGIFQVGRMDYGTFGHPFMDSSDDSDCIQYFLHPSNMGGPRWNPLLFTFAYAKIHEGDAGTILGDEDIDQYQLTLGYFSNNLTIDSMIRFERNELMTNIPFAIIDKADTWLYSLYGMAKLGIISFEGEFAYTRGYYTDPNYNNGGIWTGEMDDIELDAMGWFIQTTVDVESIDAYAGWAHTDGDKDGVKDFYAPGSTINSLPSQFGDFDILFFLTGSEGSHAATFGGLGNWSGDGGNPFGLDLLYLGGGFDITRTINISGVWGMGWADAVPSGSKRVGWEANLWLTWQIMNGLEYKALFAFFDAGDFWEDIRSYKWDNPYDTPDEGNIIDSNSDDGHCWALMHQLTLSF